MVVILASSESFLLTDFTFLPHNAYA